MILTPSISFGSTIGCVWPKLIIGGSFLDLCLSLLPQDNMPSVIDPNFLYRLHGTYDRLTTLQLQTIKNSRALIMLRQEIQECFYLLGEISL